MLFSEPKIPQSRRRDDVPDRNAVFQCSSASRKFLKHTPHTDTHTAHHSFSALQRAENSSNERGDDPHRQLRGFQCSSASRKFLKPTPRAYLSLISRRFSALQRAENSSNAHALLPHNPSECFSALQRAENSSNQPARRPAHAEGVSVLFSEPKIPQTPSSWHPSGAL